jgi:cyanophycinase-like exopeptidase
LLEQLISEQIQNFKISIGGTSAGMMILSEFVYIGNLQERLELLYVEFPVEHGTLSR